MNHIRHLLDLLAQFPRANPSAGGPSEVDIPKLFRQIRSRYKLLCATLGVRATLRAADGSATGPESAGAESPDASVREGGQPHSAKKNVWAVHKAGDALASMELNF